MLRNYPTREHPWTPLPPEEGDTELVSIAPVRLPTGFPVTRVPSRREQLSVVFFHISKILEHVHWTFIVLGVFGVLLGVCQIDVALVPSEELLQLT